MYCLRHALNGLALALGFGSAVAVAPVAIAQNLPFELDAETLTLDDVSGSAVVRAGGGATGGVEVRGPEGRLRADEIVYSAATDKIIATGNVVFTDNQDNALLVDTLELTGNLKTGVAEDLKLRLPTLGEVLHAGRATKISPTTYVFDGVIYSPCQTCVGGRKPWQVRADSVKYDQITRSATYHNAKLDVYGVPVLYLPYLSHQLGPKQPRSGLLSPQFGLSSALGNNTTLAGYVFSPAENADYTFRTRLMSKRGAQLMAERRQLGVQTDSEIRTSFLNDTLTGNVRGHGVVKAQYNHTPTLRAGVNATLASDDTYLNQFFDRDDPYLKSTLFAENAGDDFYLAANLTRFQDLNVNRAMANTAQVLPHLQAEKLFQFADGAQLLFGGDVLSLYRAAGTRSRRIIARTEYTKPMVLADGSRVELGGTLRGDVYNVDGQTGSAAAFNGTAFRALPEITALWEKPYVNETGTHTITPRVLAALGPRGGNPQKIPNEDSVAYELDVGNLFEPSRFAGLDRVETGPRVVYGLDNRWGTAGETTYRMFIGQSLRRFDDLNLPASGGASETASDWVGYLEASPNAYLGFNQNFRLDSGDFEIRRLDTSLRLGNTDAGYLLATHSFLSQGPEEFNARLDVPLTNWVSLLGRTQYDVVDSRTLLSEAGLRFKQDCFELEFTARRRGFVSGDLQPSTDYLVNLQLLSLGAD